MEKIKKKLTSEETTFEVDVPTMYRDIDEMVKAGDHLRMVSQMKDGDRERFFQCYWGCEKFEIVDQNCVGGRCFIVVKFYYIKYSEDDENGDKD